MPYFVSSADDELGDRVVETLADHGFDVVQQYRDDAVVVSLGGDGSILYNARTYGTPTILPVRTGGSEGNRIQVDPSALVDAVDRIETGTEGVDYRVERHRKLVARTDGEEVRGSFGALNDVQLHHASPVRGAKFRVRIADGDEVVFETGKAVGDGLLVATPFGSTAYFRSISGGTFTRGVGVAFNNLHKPADAPEFFVLSTEARVELAVRPVTHGENAVLMRDDDDEGYRPDPDEPVEIALSDRSVGLVRLPDRERA